MNSRCKRQDIPLEVAIGWLLNVEECLRQALLVFLRAYLGLKSNDGRERQALQKKMRCARRQGFAFSTDRCDPVRDSCLR